MMAGQGDQLVGSRRTLAGSLTVDCQVPHQTQIEKGFTLGKMTLLHLGKGDEQAGHL